QLGKARDDLELVIRLEGIRLRGATLVEGKFNYAAAPGEYATAFGEAGLTGEEEVVAARIRGSAIREQLVAALDDWALVTRDAALRARLLGLARLADPGWKWRDRFRDPQAWGDRQEMERLARAAPVAELSPPLVTLLASVLRSKGGDAEPLL